MTDTPAWSFTRLTGSERRLPPRARQVKPVDNQEIIEISVYLRDPAPSNLKTALSSLARHPGPLMSREEYFALHSADPEDVARLVQFAHHHHLTVHETDLVTRKVVLSGTVAHLTAAFGTQLHQYERNGQHFRGRTGYLHVPEDLEPAIDGVFGLDNRPQAHAQIRFAEAPNKATSFTPPQIAQLYNFPTDLDGSGQCVAIIELGGGYNEQDLTTYFKELNISQPQVVSVSVDGATNTPSGDANSADGEVALDIEVVGAVAPATKIAVYFAPNTDRGFLDAITQATHDTTNKPSVISISWGGPESSWTEQAMKTMDQAFQAAAALGITVCCAAGDNGSGDGASDDQAHVDFPASSPYALGCGGTRLEGANGKITSEVVWDEVANNEGATGGGISSTFPLPDWQKNVKVPPSVNDQKSGRGVPDVAGDADPQTGYQVYVDGQSAPIGGTSAVAPLWAGLLALINQKRTKPVGYLNPFIYQNYTSLAQKQAFHDIISGNNGRYQAATGWDACTGLGTPNGAQLLQALSESEQ